MRQIQTSSREDFDAVLVEELKILQNSERRLEKLFPKLRSQPELREYFLLELTEVRQRADRLNGVLNPLRIGEVPIAAEAPTFRPAA